MLLYVRVDLFCALKSSVCVRDVLVPKRGTLRYLGVRIMILELGRKYLVLDIIWVHDTCGYSINYIPVHT